MHTLFTVDSTFRRSGGGEIARVGEAVRFIPPSTILRVRLREDVLKVVGMLGFGTADCVVVGVVDLSVML